MDEKEITHSQFCNILAFVVVFTNNYDILNQSPDYVIEKFERYIGNPENILASDEYKTGVHHSLVKELIEPYFEKWKHPLRKMKITAILKEDGE